MRNPNWTAAEIEAVSRALDYRASELQEMADGNDDEEGGDGGDLYREQLKPLVGAMRKFDEATRNRVVKYR